MKAWLAAAWAGLKVALGIGEKIGEEVKEAGADRRAKADLAESEANVREVDRVAGDARAAGPEERTPPASPAARRPPG